MVNLLPQPVVRSLKRQYYLRLVTLVATMVALVFLLGGVLLAPSFFLARATAEAGERYLSALEDIVGLRERANVSEEVAALAERVATLGAYARPPVFAPVAEALSDAIPRGVTMTAFSLIRLESGAVVSISGSAVSRDTLLSFAAALKEVPTFSGVSLPVAALASDKDISFTLEFSYAPMP